MGFFDFIDKIFIPSNLRQLKVEPPIPPEEKKYYQPDSYYTSTVPVAAVDMNGNYVRRKVITFNEMATKSFPSQRGLYVAEILLLQYCSYGTYPHPKNGYPGFWWFEYGIRNVGYRLETLRERGFIRYSTAAENVKTLTNDELKQLLKLLGQKVSGKKDELIDRVLMNASDEFLVRNITERKYCLTDLGRQELRDNEYVPFLHQSHGTVTVWEINQELKGGDTTNWKKIVAKKEREYKAKFERQKQHNLKMARKLDLDPQTIALQKKLAAQDMQLKTIQDAENLYKETNDINSLIAFWENIWKHGGLLFEGSYWMFRLPDLYIKCKRYDEALYIIRKIKDPYYKDKKNKYFEKIERLKSKLK